MAADPTEPQTAAYFVAHIHPPFDAQCKVCARSGLDAGVALDAELRKQRGLPMLMRSSGYEAGIEFALRALASSGEAAPVDGLRSLAGLSAKATPGPWIRRWASLDVHHMTGDDALQAQADIDFAVAACAYVRAALAREEADDGR